MCHFCSCFHPGIRVLALRRRQIHSPQRAAESFDPSLQRSQNGDRGGGFDRWPPGIHDLLEEQVSLLKTAHRRSLADVLHSHEGPSKWTQKYSLSCKFTFNKQAGQFSEMGCQEWKNTKICNNFWGNLSTKTWKCSWFLSFYAIVCEDVHLILSMYRQTEGIWCCGSSTRNTICV